MAHENVFIECLKEKSSHGMEWLSISNMYNTNSYRVCL